MDWKIFLSTFVTIFLAEMGDKTQFAAMAASSASKSTWTVLLAVILGLSCAGVIGVVFGRAIADIVSPNMIKYISGSLFIMAGLWILLARP